MNCCQCENVASTKSNSQLEIGNTSTMATFSKTFTRDGDKDKCCQCENVASIKSNPQFVYAKATANKLEIGNIGIGNTSTMATFSKMCPQTEDKCCQCENVASTNSNTQFVYAKAMVNKLEIGNIGIGNTSTMATFSKMFARTGDKDKCCQCENVASTKSNTQFVYAKATVNKLEIGNTGIGNTSTMATFNKMFTRDGDKDKCCQCENVASIKSNPQFVYAKATANKLEIGNIGIGNTSTMATFSKMFARVVVGRFLDRINKIDGIKKGAGA